MQFFPDTLPDDDDVSQLQSQRGPQLPNVTVTSSPEDIRRAFDAVAKAGPQQQVGSSSTMTSSTDQSDS